MKKIATTLIALTALCAFSAVAFAEETNNTAPAAEGQTMQKDTTGAQTENTEKKEKKSKHHHHGKKMKKHTEENNAQ